MSTTFTLAIKAPLPLPAEGVTSVAFKAHINSLIPFLEQDVVNYFFLEEENIYTSWTAKQDSTKRISILAGTDPDKVSLDSKLAAEAITALDHTAKTDELLKKRNSQLSKFIHLIAISCHYTEHSDINQLSTSFQWIVQYLERHYNIETKGAHFMNVAKITFKKGAHPQTFYKQFRAQIQDNLRKKGEIMMHKNNQELREDETISSSFESTIVLWSLEKIDPRLPARVAKLYGHQMTGNKTLVDLQSTIFQDIPAILLDLDNEENKSMLGATKLGKDDQTELNFLRTEKKFKRKSEWRNRGEQNNRGDRNYRGDRNFNSGRKHEKKFAKPPANKETFCHMCKLAGSSPSHFKSHEIGECNLLTRNDVSSIARMHCLDESEDRVEEWSKDEDEESE